MAYQAPQLRLPFLALDETTVKEIETIFQLTRSTTTDWTEFRAPVEFPHELDHQFAIAENALASANLSMDLRRMGSYHLLHIFIAAVSAADRLNLSVSGDRPFPIWRGCFCSFYPVPYEEKNHSLDGAAWHTLWFHPTDSMNYLDVNFFARGTEVWEEAPPVSSMLAMMAMARSQRQYGDVPQHTMYGLACHMDKFVFLELNPEGQWSKYDLKYPLYRQEILETFAFIFQQARLLMTSYYGVDGGMAHLTGAQALAHASNRGQRQIKSTRGPYTLEIMEKDYSWCDEINEEEFNDDDEEDNMNLDEEEVEEEVNDGLD